MRIFLVVLQARSQPKYCKIIKFPFAVLFPHLIWKNLSAILFHDCYDGTVFLEFVLDIQLCGNTRQLKYRLMPCESYLYFADVQFFFSFKKKKPTVM